MKAILDNIKEWLFKDQAETVLGNFSESDRVKFCHFLETYEFPPDIPRPLEGEKYYFLSEKSGKVEYGILHKLVNDVFGKGNIMLLKNGTYEHVFVEQIFRELPDWIEIDDTK